MTAQTSNQTKNLPVRDTLFGDLPLSYWGSIDSSELPWTLFKKAKDFDEDGEDADAVKELQAVLAVPGLESRQYLQAHHFLHKMYAVKQDSSRLYGVVVEIGMELGNDMLAVYEDHSARYYNYSGSAVVLDTSNAAISKQIDSILSLGREILPNIGPWNYARPDAPKKEMARINFLTAGGLHFGEAHQAILFKDAMAGKIMFAMFTLMETMINLGTEK